MYICRDEIVVELLQEEQFMLHIILFCSGIEKDGILRKSYIITKWQAAKY